jgi:hypothetical protein
MEKQKKTDWALVGNSMFLVWILLSFFNHINGNRLELWRGLFFLASFSVFLFFEIMLFREILKSKDSSNSTDY